jgi:hypothetical protein
VGVSTTARPVTHTADVAVNSASRKVVVFPVSAAAGSISSAVTTNTATANAATPTCVGCGVRNNRASRAWMRRTSVGHGGA